MEKNIEFRIGLVFRGSPDEFEGFMGKLKSLGPDSIMIDTVPLPENPASGLMIDTVPLPEKWKNVFLGYLQDPEKRREGIFIGSWPTPEGDLGPDKWKNIAKGKTRVRILDDIHGGMRLAHFHMNDEIVLVDPEGMKDYIGLLVDDLSRQFR
jgi:hypothetical protein